VVTHRKPQLDLGMMPPECRQRLQRKITSSANEACRYAAAFDALELPDLVIAFGKQRLDLVRRLDSFDGAPSLKRPGELD
jgi:hypothetical protein